MKHPAAPETEQKTLNSGFDPETTRVYQNVYILMQV
jgi:hypothetical protein